MIGKIALCFPGQGSQYVGMGKEFLDVVPGAREVFSSAERVTGIPVESLCIDGPVEELTKTINLQPCLTAVGIICAMAVMDAGIKPDAVAGHSLGEYPALWVSGVLNMDDTFRLVRYRGQFMEDAAQKNPGAMAAVIGLEKEKLEDLVGAVAASGGVLSLANYNSPDQIVITGEKHLVSEACKAVKQAGGRAVPLKVSGAYHSDLMKDAADAYSLVLAELDFSAPRMPFYSNVTGKAEYDPDKIRQLMAKQICSPVRWSHSISNMAQDGIGTFIEAGPKKVLTNLIRKCLPDSNNLLISVENPEGLQSLKEELD